MAGKMPLHGQNPGNGIFYFHFILHHGESLYAGGIPYRVYKCNILFKMLHFVLTLLLSAFPGNT